MRRILFCILSILIIIASCFTVVSAQSDDSSQPSISYWESVWEHIKICTYYQRNIDGPDSIAPPGESTSSGGDYSHKPEQLIGYYDEIFEYYSAGLSPADVSDLDFYRSSYEHGEYNAAYYIDIPFNLKSGNLNFEFNYEGGNAVNSYTDSDEDVHYFTSFREMMLSPYTSIEAYAYDSEGNYRLLIEPEFAYTEYILDQNCSYKFFLNLNNITDLSYLKIVFRLKTNETFNTGDGVYFISGIIPYYHELTLDQQYIYVPPTYEDMVISGVVDVSNKLDDMLFPDSYTQNQVNDLNNKLENTQQNVSDLNAGLEIDAPSSIDDVFSQVNPYFSILDFGMAEKSIGRFWKASVVMRMLMVVGFFSYISFILFGKKA